MQDQEGRRHHLQMDRVLRGRNRGSPVVRGLPETWSDYQR